MPCDIISPVPTPSTIPATSDLSLPQSCDEFVPKRQREYLTPPPSKRGRPSALTIATSSLRTLLQKPPLPGTSHFRYNPISSSRPISKSKSLLIHPNESPICNAKQILIDELNVQKAAVLFFPPKLTDLSTRNAIRRFQSHVDKVVADTKDVYSCCGLFIPAGTSHSVNRLDPILQQGLQLFAFIYSSLDCCGQDNTNLLFCKPCLCRTKELKPPKFGATNIVNVCTCQDYPGFLKDLTLVEEAVIACAHPVISIIKLRPSSTSLSASYHRICGHAVVLPQNPGPLLDLLPSNTLQLHDIIRVVWAGKRPHTLADIRSFGRIRKARVLSALL